MAISCLILSTFFLCCLYKAFFCPCECGLKGEHLSGVLSGFGSDLSNTVLSGEIGEGLLCFFFKISGSGFILEGYISNLTLYILVDHPVAVFKKDVADGVCPECSVLGSVCTGGDEHEV